MKKIVFLFLFALLILRANCQTGATQRTALVNLQKAGIVESSRAGQFGLTDANGNQRYAQFVEVDLTPIAYTPPTTGNTQNFSEFVTTTGGDIYYIDWQGRSIKLWDASAGGGGTSDFDWLEIGNNQVPNSILDSIYTSKYAAVNMRRVWPNAQLLVGDSTGTNGASGIAAGDRSARWGFVRMLDGSWSSIGQEGTNNTVRLGPGTQAMKIQVAAGASPSEAVAPFRDVASFRTDSLIRFNDYPNTRDDAETAVNFFYSDAQGYLKSGPVSEISGGGGADSVFNAGYYTPTPAKIIIDNGVYTGQTYMQTRSDGSILMAYRNAGGHVSGGGLWFRESNDEGKTWVNQRNYISPSGSDHYAAPAITVIGHDSIFMTYQNLGAGLCYWTLSTNNGNTWSTPTVFPNLAGYTWGPYIEGHSAFKNGAWVVPVFGDTIPGGAGTSGKSGVYRSTNYGASWTFHKYANASPDVYDENGLITYGDSIVAFIRMENTNRLKRSASIDGITWTTPKDVTPERNYAGKPAPFVTSTGVIVLAGRESNGIQKDRFTYFCESSDGGNTWRNRQTVETTGFYYYGDFVEISNGDLVYTGGVDTLYPNRSYIVQINYTPSILGYQDTLRISGGNKQPLYTAQNGLSMRGTDIQLGGPATSGLGQLNKNTEIPTNGKDLAFTGTGRVGIGFTVLQLTSPTNMVGYSLAINGKLWLQHNTTNSVIGNLAGFSMSTATGCTINGYRAFNAGNGDYMTVYGSDAVRTGTGARRGTVSGALAATGLSGDDCTYSGYRAGNGATFAYDNTVTGSEAMDVSTVGSFNTVSGSDALGAASVTGNNTVSGASVFLNATSMTEASVSGSNAFYYTQTGYGHTGLGFRAAYGNINGQSLSAEGYESLYCNGSANEGVGLGIRTLFYNRLSNNTAIGANSFNLFQIDSTTAKTATVSGQNWTVTGHGYPTGHLVGMWVSASVSAPTPLTNNSPYVFRVTDANTLILVFPTLTGVGSGTITLYHNKQFTNSTALGHNAEPTKSNQAVIGNGITELKIGNVTTDVSITGAFPIVLKASATLDFPATTGPLPETLTVTVPGAVMGDMAQVAPVSGWSTTSFLLSAMVTGTNQVTIQAVNLSGISVDIAAQTYNVIVTKF